MYETGIASLTDRIAQLEKQLETEKSVHAANVSFLEKHVTSLQEQVRVVLYNTSRLLTAIIVLNVSYAHAHTHTHTYSLISHLSRAEAAWFSLFRRILLGFHGTNACVAYRVCVCAMFMLQCV